MKISVVADCFKLNIVDSIKKAAELGLDGVQIYATTGEFSPRLSRVERDAYKSLLAETGLTLSALCGDMGGHGFEIEADNAHKVSATKEIVDLAADFSCPVITTHIGVIPDDPDHPTYAVMFAALDTLGIYAKERGVTLAIETGPESAATLKSFIERTHGGVGVNLDPANFVMVTGEDPVKAVYMLRDHIVHTHAKDGVMLKKTDPKIIYDHFAKGGIEALNIADYFLETVLGEGGVDFPAYLAALRDIGFTGYLAIERETGADPAADISLAAKFLEKTLKNL